MFSNRFRNAVVDGMFGAISIVGGIVAVGYIVNSQAAHNVRQMPAVGPLLDPPVTAVRRAWNKVYDVATED